MANDQDGDRPVGRRSLILGVLATGAGVLGGGCDVPPVEKRRVVPPMAPEVVREGLDQLVAETRTDRISLVIIRDKVSVDQVLPDGRVRSCRYTRARNGGAWYYHQAHRPDPQDPPEWVGLDDLPLDRLSRYYEAAGPRLEELWLAADAAGKVVVSDGIEQGLRPDGSGRYESLSERGSAKNGEPLTAAGVRRGIDEIVELYGDRVSAIQLRDEAVWVSLTVPGVEHPLFVVREDAKAPRALRRRGPLDPGDRVFDPSRFDPTIALDQRSLAERAGVPGQVRGWSYERPPQGGPPLLRFWVTASREATHYVWLDDAGNIAKVIKKAGCKPGTAWCPDS